MAQKLFYFPQPDSGGKYQNPYSYNFKHGLQQFFDVVDSEKSQTKLKSLGLLTHSAAAHIYILNWVESIPHLRFSLFQTMIVLFSLKIMKLRYLPKILISLHRPKKFKVVNTMVLL